MEMAVVSLKKGAGRSLKAGGAWIYDNEIDCILGDFENGDLVTVHDFDGYFMYSRARKRCSLQNHLSNKKQGESVLKHKIKREFQEFVIVCETQNQ